MRLLLDTCTFLWLSTDDPRVSDDVRLLFAEPSNDVYLSSASCWEIAVKHRLGRLSLPEHPDRLVPQLRRQHRIEALALDEESALHEALLPTLHRDPFDRMLVCQAIVHGLVLLTPDEAVRQYPVRTIW